MFFRSKRSGQRTYLQIVENRWEDGGPRQRVLATLGRLDELQARGALEALLTSGGRFCEKLLVVSEHERGALPAIATRRIGPNLVLGRLWRDTGCQKVLETLQRGAGHRFSLERAIFLTVLHRLMVSGSDRAADQWRHGYGIEGVADLDLHHLYRAMAWLGEELPAGQQIGHTELSPRCRKDLVEERLFQRRRSLFSGLDLVFFDTTSMYFEGAGGATLGAYGHSKDHRPDLKQVVVSVILDREGHPLCCELWPGSTTDVKSLVPVVDRLRRRFAIDGVCIVADRGMISAATVAALEERGWGYILGARMRRDGEVRDEVLGRAGRFQVVHGERERAKDPSPLKVKEVWTGGRRYVVCLNDEQARKDAADRAAIVAALQEQLSHGDKSLVGNKGYRKFLRTTGRGLAIDEEKIREEERFDGRWVLRTNTDLPAAEVALKYKQLWTVETIFRSMKSLLETRPNFHKRDATIRGHIFCSFLALVLRKELQDRLVQAGGKTIEWAEALRDIEQLTEIEIQRGNQHFILRDAPRGVAGRVFQAVGVTLPPTIRRLPQRPPG